MKNVQCRAITVARAMTNIDADQLQARKKEWERQQKQQQIRSEINEIFIKHSSNMSNKTN